MRAINKRLLDNLFNKPNPQPESKMCGHFYKVLSRRLFPDKSDFIAFLNSDTFDGQYHYAQNIIRKLCFDSNFPPPHSSFLEVVATEHSKRTDISSIKGNYVARDHFLHIVYLYMLGIYLFFYDKIFYDKILDYFRFQRQRTPNANIDLDAVKDFLSAWKYFCLYHDLGYSIEIIGITSEGSNPPQNLNAPRTFEKDRIKLDMTLASSIKCLAKLLVARQLVDSSTLPFTLKNPTLDRIREDKAVLFSTETLNRSEDARRADEQTFETIIEKYIEGSPYLDNKKKQLGFACLEEWRLLDKIYTNHCLKVVLPLFSTQDFIILALRKDDGLPAFCILPGSTRTIMVFEHMELTGEIKKIIKNPNLLFYDDYSTQNFALQFFLNTDVTRKAFSIAGEDENTLSQHYEDALINIKEKLESNFLRVTDEQQLFQYQFNLFKLLSQKFSAERPETSAIITKMLAPSDVNVSHEEILANVRELVFNELKPNVSNAFYHGLANELMKQNISYSYEKGNLVPVTFTNYIGSIKDDLLAKLTSDDHAFIDSYATDFVAQHISTLTVAQNSEYSLWFLFSKVLAALKENWGGDTGAFEYDYATHIVNKDFDCATLTSDNTERVFNEHFECSHDRLFSEYKYPHGSRNDHGFISAYHYAFITALNSRLIASLDQKLIAILYTGPSETIEIERKFKHNYIHIHESVFFALFVHNIYPEYLPNGMQNKYRIGINQPFALFSLICDALQQWNRPHLLHPIGLEDKPNLDAGNDYDILVNEGYITVFDTNDVYYQDRIMRNIDGLRAYIRHPEAYIRCGFSK